VAGSCNIHFTSAWTVDSLWRRFCDQSVHLYTVLAMKEKHVGTALVFTIVGVILFLIYGSRYFLYAALVFGCIGLFIPALSLKIHQGWMFVGEGIGFVMNKVILSIVFFVFLLPIAFISRFFRKTTFDKRPQAGSYFAVRNQLYTAKDLEDPW
jgi:hypothetical protein